MIKSIEFSNFRALRKAVLPLGPLTIIVGPNGSGKSTALFALQVAANANKYTAEMIASAGMELSEAVSLRIRWDLDALVSEFRWSFGRVEQKHVNGRIASASERQVGVLNAVLRRVKIYAFDPSAISRPAHLEPNIELGQDGSLLVGVLDRLRDREPERFDRLNEELRSWLPEFDRFLFDTPSTGSRSLRLRTRTDGHSIPVQDVSHGSLLAIAMLTLAYLPDPPPVICIEEPERGIHPRLLRHVLDALNRLTAPEEFGETRQKVQVVATTHSPYFLDLFRDHPEDIVIAHKVGRDAQFEPLRDRTDLQEILRDTHLGDAWYSGVLGGVPKDQ